MDIMNAVTKDPSIYNVRQYTSRRGNTGDEYLEAEERTKRDMVDRFLVSVEKIKPLVDGIFDDINNESGDLNKNLTSLLRFSKLKNGELEFIKKYVTIKYGELLTQDSQDEAKINAVEQNLAKYLEDPPSQ